MANVRGLTLCQALYYLLCVYYSVSSSKQPYEGVIIILIL